MEKEDKASKSMTKWLGVTNMNSLAKMTGYKNEDDLNACVSIYTNSANEERSTRLSLFSAAIDALLDKRDIEGFSLLNMK